MFSSIVRKFSRIPIVSHTRPFSVKAKDLFEMSCYSNIDYKINQNAVVQEAVIRFSAFDVGCLAVVDNSEKLVGIFSEGDFIKRVASVGKDSSQVQIKDVCTLSPNILIANPDETLEDCMNKMNFKNIRHLVVLDEKQNLDGLISIKDVFRATIQEKKKMITRLADFNTGKGAFFGSE